MHIIDDLTLWINENLESELSINIVSAKSGYSAWHLQRVFKIATGESLGKYIKVRRLMAAAEELSKSDCPACRVYLKYNYDSYHSFSRAFKAYFKASPRQYRNKSL
ncbi:helix-turn-helix domain-containing protein [Pantoea agglomerans]|uniref:helix-turn-helix domain-containing protein n=1 Tax=Enterobacter agglomerans TaxID=549 RepID=UPI0039831E53